MKDKSLGSLYTLIGIVFSVLLVFGILMKYERMKDENLPIVCPMIDALGNYKSGNV